MFSQSRAQNLRFSAAVHLHKAKMFLLCWNCKRYNKKCNVFFSDKQNITEQHKQIICQSAHSRASKTMQIISSVLVDSSRNIWCCIGTVCIYPVHNKPQVTLVSFIRSANQISYASHKHPMKNYSWYNSRCDNNSCDGGGKQAVWYIGSYFKDTKCF